MNKLFLFTIISLVYSYHLFANNHVKHLINNGQIYKEEMTIPLESDIEIKAYRVKELIEKNGLITWVGKVYGDHLGLVVLTQNDQFDLYGSIYAFSKSYTLSPTTNLKSIDNVSALEVSNRQEPGIESLDYITPETTYRKVQKVQAAATSSADNGDVVDLMVVYTADAAAETSDIEAQITNGFQVNINSF